jgi:DNA-binding response OmpR family regulator
VIPARILVVDDDPEVVTAVSAVLSPEGYRVEGSSDGAEALRQVLESPPDLIVLDVNLPNVSGWEFCDILRRQSHTRAVPVLFLTGRTELRDRIIAMQVGGSAYLQKPFGAEDLRLRVRSLMQEAS